MRETCVLMLSWCVLTTGGCNGGGGGNPPPPVVHTLTGTVTVNNDCDGQVASIPANITVSAGLMNANANVTVGGTTNIALAPVAGGNPIKTGAYTITVNWLPGAAGAAANWGNFTETLVGGGDICASIPCTTNTCKNLATRVRTTPVTGVATTNDVRMSCTCVP